MHFLQQPKKILCSTFLPFFQIASDEEKTITRISTGLSRVDGVTTIQSQRDAKMTKNFGENLSGLFLVTTKIFLLSKYLAMNFFDNHFSLFFSLVNALTYLTAKWYKAFPKPHSSTLSHTSSISLFLVHFLSFSLSLSCSLPLCLTLSHTFSLTSSLVLFPTHVNAMKLQHWFTTKRIFQFFLSFHSKSFYFGLSSFLCSCLSQPSICDLTAATSQHSEAARGRKVETWQQPQQQQQQQQRSKSDVVA